ncbi:ser thr phosphatase family protein [Colletotrichum truncatum]|uniref:Ser thr phosphatase family protein n=1 Tax=Colletotrichum truncatum TaxID=5467 RepID=A0ACC3YWP0_COLTU|nr:ser thr phosphatase family protein [Colletotrichum truncatum]KAF6787537.1 ser thr phosphatase family protein [Colletotrichum truncatum]
MGNTDAAFLEHSRSAGVAFGTEPLLELPDGQIVDLANGYIPLLAQFTFEDKAAKGLRKRKVGEKLEQPVYFTAIELVRDNKILLLSGVSGSGKTTFGKYLSFALATARLKDPRSLIRNEFGDTREEVWDAGHTLPYYFPVTRPESLQSLENSVIPRLLESGARENANIVIVVDAIDKGGNDALRFITSVVGLVRALDHVKVLLLGEADTCHSWKLPSDIVRYDLLPLLKTHRKEAVSHLLGFEAAQAGVGIGDASANAGLFALALRSSHPGHQAEELLDSWLSVLNPERREAELAASRINDDTLSTPSYDKLGGSDPAFLASTSVSTCGIVQQLLFAKHLATLPIGSAVSLFLKEPCSSKQIICSCLTRLNAIGKSNDLIEALLSTSGTEAQRAGLLVAKFVPENSKINERIISLMLDIITEGKLPAAERKQAGHLLSRLGDPRDLKILAEVPAGTFTMGSGSHPNSQPVEPIQLPAFRIGVYPVINKDYLSFVRATGRDWFSPDGHNPATLNAPATDLTWHDARAYCAWLTALWRTNGKISPNEEVRLPTEPEWERASRGDQQSVGDDELVYPWGTDWIDDASNSEETGFNTTCAVGLFPKGISPYGCHDMAGHAWEWCTTAWGDDMAEPIYKYPWRDDGRESMDAPEQIRRVLRGGCFSSPKIKANCTYRGSLEPGGFWRGNGFRVVVSRVVP